VHNEKIIEPSRNNSETEEKKEEGAW